MKNCNFTSLKFGALTLIRLPLILLVFFITGSVSTFSQTKTPKYSNEFLSIGIGARSMAMSGSVAASVDDAGAAYWNPARLYLMKGERQLNLMHAEYFAGIAKYDYGSLGVKLDDSSALAFSFIRFGVDNIPNTIDLIDSQGNINYDRITTFSVADMAFLFSYGRKLNVDNLSLGGSVKIIRRKIGDFAGAWGFGLDFGISYMPGPWLFAAVARDATSTFNAWSFQLSDRMKEVFTITGNIIPENSLEITTPSLLLAAARSFSISPSFSVLPEAGLNMTFDGKRNVPVKTNFFSIDPHLGIELSYKGFLFFRTGIGDIQQETNRDGEKITSFRPNMGIGINIQDRLSVDYALTAIGNRSMVLNSNIFSLKIAFNRNQK
jgi:hypothetical protein